jgi:hypothetical protein
MKKVLLWIVGVLALVVVVFVVVVAMQPTEFSYARSATINAPPAAVFPHVNDFHNWNDWSPWAKLDPNCKYSYEGPDSGKDAKFLWSGNDEVGEGSMTIVDSKPDELVQISLDFVKPMEGHSMVDFTFVPEGDGTKVTWKMYGENNFIGRAMCLIMNMDKLMGEKFDEGLASMKSVVEAKTQN